MMNETRRYRVARVSLLLILPLAAVVCALPFLSSHAQTKSTPPESEYSRQVMQGYDMKFGPNPFAPSNASSTTGTFIPGEMFVPAKRCGTCHTDAHAQWRQSAHGNAFREPFYQKNVKDIQNQKGLEYTRHCESCHNPAALFT